MVRCHVRKHVQRKVPPLDHRFINVPLLVFRYTILSENCIATPICFASHFINIQIMVNCFVVLETAFISE